MYVRSTPKGPRFWTLRVEGSVVETATGADPAKLKARSRSFADAHEARAYATKTRLQKLREGFIFLRDRATAAPGEVVVRVALPHAQLHDFFDVHPTRPWLVVGSERRPTNDEAWVHVVELDTGTIREVFHTHGPGPWTSHTQTFSHCVRFTAGGDAVVTAINGVTLRIDLADGTVRQLAAYQESSYDAHFNAHCVWPSRDLAAERVLVFDRDDVLRVVDGHGGVCFETSVRSPSVECRAGALSPSGRRVGAFMVSRAVSHGHTDAAHDSTCEVRVWDVDSGAEVARVAMPWQVRELGFTPDDRLLIVQRAYHLGPAFFEVASGRLVRVASDPRDDASWPTCRAWACAPDGTRVAVLDGELVKMLDVERGVTDPLELSTATADLYRCQRLMFSGHGHLLFAGDATGEIVGFRSPIDGGSR